MAFMKLVRTTVVIGTSAATIQHLEEPKWLIKPLSTLWKVILAELINGIILVAKNQNTST
jgi:hypothetical protein